MDPKMMRAVRQATHTSPKAAHLLQQCWSLAIIAAVAATLIVNVACAQTGNRPRGGSLTILPMQGANRGSDNSSQDRHYYGVLGSVARPGVYVTDNSQLTLAALVEAAQGPTPEAAEIASVVRRGRAGLKFRYAPESGERLQSGDVVVVGRRQQAPLEAEDVGSHSEYVRESVSQMTAVAFVGLVDGRPIVSSVSPNTTLPDLVANLYQRPEIVRSVRVIRSDVSATDSEFDPASDSLTDGDVVVFDPADVDQASFAQAGDYPPAVPIDSTTDRSEDPVISSTPPSPTDGSAAPTVSSASPPGDVDPETSLPTIQPHTPSALAAPSFPALEPTAVVADGPGVPSPAETVLLETPADSSDLSPPPPVLTGPAVAPISLVDSTIEERTVNETDPLPSLERLVPAPAEPEPASDLELPEEPFERVAMQVEPMPAPAMSASQAEPQEARVESEVPPPIQRPTKNVLPDLGSKATMLGITVLAVALLCFLGSLLWSKLDESSGRMQAEQEMPAESEESPILPSGSQMLNRLLANRIPMIEEEVTLPERLSFHGEVVGRRRLRIDARHDVARPHFPATHGDSTAGAEQTAASRQKASATSRVDTTSSMARKDSGQAPRSTTTHGLLERVLVAMEREKRR